LRKFSSSWPQQQQKLLCSDARNTALISGLHGEKAAFSNNWCMSAALNSMATRSFLNNTVADELLDGALIRVIDGAAALHLQSIGEMRKDCIRADQEAIVAFLLQVGWTSDSQVRQLATQVIDLPLARIRHVAKRAAPGLLAKASVHKAGAPLGGVQEFKTPFLDNPRRRKDGSGPDRRAAACRLRLPTEKPRITAGIFRFRILPKSRRPIPATAPSGTASRRTRYERVGQIRASPPDQPVKPDSIQFNSSSQNCGLWFPAGLMDRCGLT
jgi:hypothetical protein